MELSCGLPPGPDFTELVVLAEELGYSRAWIHESAPVWEDPFVHLALAAGRTTRIGLGAAVLVPEQRSVMAMASGIATIARVSGGRFRACFGTGFSARLAIGRRPMPITALGEYVRALRGLLAGRTVTVDGRPVRMLHAADRAAARPLDVPLWLSVFGPRGAALAGEVADGVIGPVHPTLPTATIVSGTVLDPGEDRGSPRVREAIGPRRLGAWHGAYATHGAEAVDALPGGAAWRKALEALAPEDERHLLVFEGHDTELTERDRELLPYIDVDSMVAEAPGIDAQLASLAASGFQEIVYTPSGPDVARELRAFAAAHRPAAR
ncbi:LLM class flavin-dependent oxidoreductase [Streptomyces sp. NPDC101175]|uniref:LLM class flavin-dependent oxidoreductase n=1 Tax=Streptomyces sp. NPDC101175 TaxID=3366123 RepID=UPI003836935D